VMIVRVRKKMKLKESIAMTLIHMKFVIMRNVNWFIDINGLEFVSNQNVMFVSIKNFGTHYQKDCQIKKKMKKILKLL